MMEKKTPVKSEDRLLFKLAKGGVLKKDGDGLYRLGRQEIHPRIVDALMAKELVRPLAGGRLDLSPSGLAWVRRARASRDLGRHGSSGGDSISQESFRAQHQLQKPVIRGAREGHARVVVNQGESPLGWLSRHKDGRGRAYLSQAQVDAGERLRADFELAGLSPRVTAAWTGIPADKRRKGRREKDLTMSGVAARERFHKAVAAMGPGLADAAVRACCFLEGLEAIEKRRGWPARSGKVVLAIALDRLAEHYGIK